MKLSPARSPDRRGFTLIELLVVITIIALLVALLSAAVMRALRLGKVTANKHDIDQLSTAVVNFTTSNKVDYIPSRIHLSENCVYNLTNPTGPNYQLDVDSVAFLSRLWPRANFQPGNGNWYDWNGDGQDAIDLQKGEFYLEGDQCLVFFLGGIPSKVNGVFGTTGFSAVPRDPTYHTSWQAKGGSGPGNVIPPVFEFDSNRLADLAHQSSNNQNIGFCSYLDAYKKQPYAYFSSYNKSYNRYYNPNTNPASDCISLGIWPYAEALRTASSAFPDLKYIKPSGFQIISAGPDKLFGPGTSPNGPFWSAGTADNYPAPGSDDQASFHPSELGSSS
ncbi:MAG TPA: prepilin-type N-terminal cleavage/methylation domain-containing protein [Gemmataceae bacterium]|jgi:prepilin-type N-terminal cleavage/methylation domain-containing protein|nr:prepilin-type N-terminal cleavage/methylation domain-containing protein [Gemmataceae bacterium]